MSTLSRLPVRSWMFVYLGLLAAIVMSGSPEEAGATRMESTTNPPLIVDSPTVRRDI